MPSRLNGCGSSLPASTSTTPQPEGDFRAPDAEVSDSLDTTTTAPMTSGSKVITLRAIRGSSVTVPFNVEREARIRDNLRANGFKVLSETTTEIHGRSR
jgi:hypothetical protein